MAVVRSTRDEVVIGTDRWVEFGSAVAVGNLVAVYSANGGAADTSPPTAPAGWTEVLFLRPFEGNKSPGKLFAKICDGGADFNAAGFPGRVGPFGNQSTAGILGIEASGIGSATPDYTNVEATVSQPSGDYNHTQAAITTESSLCIMVQQGEFGDEYVFSAVAPTLETDPPSGTGNPGQTFTVVTRIAGPGSVDLTVRTEDNTSAMWRQSGVAVFIAGGAPAPPSEDPPAVDVIDGVTGLLIGSIEDATDVEIRIERQGTGYGKFTIRRDSPNATEAILAQGNIFQIRIPRIDADPIFAFLSEPGIATVVSSDEEGGENITVGGRGALAYLENGVELQESLVGPPGIPEGGVIRTSSTGNLPGQLLNRILEEFLDPGRPSGGPVPLLTKDFNYTVDSDGNAWASSTINDELFGYVGDDGLEYVARIMGSGVIDVIMNPDLSIQAFNSYGRNLSSATFAVGKVRFVKGANIEERLERATGGELPPSWALVSGEEDAYSSASIVTGKPTREVFIRTAGTDPTSLTAVGAAELSRRLSRNESIAFPAAIVDTGDEDELVGRYLPGPPGTNGHFWIGDTVTVHTGTAEWDLNNRAVRIQALTITVDEANNLDCSVEVVGVFPNVRGRPRVEGRTSTDAGSSGGSLPTTNPPPDGGSTSIIGLAAHTGDTSDAHDASAISFTPTGTIAATNAQAAIAEVAAEAGAAADTHIADATDAHDASAISVLDTGGNFTGTDVEAVLAELDASISAGGIPATIFDAKGDIIVATAADTATRKAAGANDTILMADSGQSDGLKWVASQTPTTQAFSDAATEGTADTYSRGDHKHGMPADPGGGSAEFSEAGASVLTDATATGDAGSRSDQFPGTSLGGAWSSEAFAVTSLAVKYSTVSIVAGAGGENHQVQAFTPSGAFRLEARMWTTGGSSASIMVRDSGTGIAGEAALFLFIPDSSMGLYTLDAGAYNFRQAATGTYRGGWMYVYIARDGSNNWTGGFSFDRVKWVNTASHSKTFTVDKMAIRTASGTTGVTGCDFVDVVS